MNGEALRAEAQRLDDIAAKAGGYSASVLRRRMHKGVAPFDAETSPRGANVAPAPRVPRVPASPALGEPTEHDNGIAYYTWPLILDATTSARLELLAAAHGRNAAEILRDHVDALWATLDVGAHLARVHELQRLATEEP